MTTLSECTYANTDKFSFNDREFQSKCVKVYDGDSITVVFETFGKFYRFSVRMYGYDTPELRSSDETEKKYANLSRDCLASLILDKIITVKCRDYDKYGRILADVHIDDINVNEHMLQHGYARPYDGGKKIPWDFKLFE